MILTFIIGTLYGIYITQNYEIIDIENIFVIVTNISKPMLQYLG